MKKFFAAIAILVLSLIGLTACSASGIQAGSQLSIGELVEFNSINGDNVTGDGSRYTNEQIAALVDPGFYFTDAAGTLVANKTFGSVKVISKNPFQVRYSLTGTAKWSDGQQLTASDLLLSWLAAKNPLDAGFNSIRSGSGMQWANSVPVASADQLSLTIKFDHPVSDYKTVLTINGAAHVAAKKAFAIQDNAEALARFDTAVKDANLEDQKLIAASYAEIYLARNLSNPEAKIGAGPYLIESYDPGKALTLKANAAFSWGPPPTIEKVTVRLYSDSTTILAAMQSGLVDIAAPQESGIATIADITALAKSSGAKIEIGASNDVEAVLLNFASGSVFHSDANLRSAFLKLIPTAKIQAALSADSPVIKAKSWIYSNSSNYYQPFIESNGSAAFEIQNAEAAAELIAKVDVRKPIDLRVLYDSDNPRSRQEFTLLGQYANSVGFNLIDVSTKDPREVYLTGQFDAYITTVALAGETGGNPYWFTGNSVTGFKSTEVDQLLATFSTQVDETDRVSTLKKLDGLIYSSQFGLPLYQVPSILVYGKRIKTIVDAPTGGSATYGYWNWTLSK